MAWLNSLGGAAGAAGSAVGTAATTAGNALSSGLGGALGSFGGELGAGGMGPATGASGFLGGLGQSMGGLPVASPGLDSLLGQLTGAGMQMRGGNRMGGLQSLAQMTGMMGPATRQAQPGIQPQQQKGLLNGLLSR